MAIFIKYAPIGRPENFEIKAATAEHLRMWLSEPGKQVAEPHLIRPPQWKITPSSPYELGKDVVPSSPFKPGLEPISK